MIRAFGHSGRARRGLGPALILAAVLGGPSSTPALDADIAPVLAAHDVTVLLELGDRV